MKILPAIDLRGGRVVRLEQGRADAETVYSDDPVAVALDFKKQGAEELHVVDLDGAFTGKPQNLEIVARIVKAFDRPVELGGGLRDLETIRKAIEIGVRRVVLGTKACDSLEFVRQIVDECGGERVAVGIDAKNGKVATKGWTEVGDWDAITLAQGVSVAGAETIIYTDIATDGMFTGPNLPALRDLLEATDCRVIASGGVSTVEHVDSLRALGQLYGVIIGKAIYDKKLSLAEIL